MNLGEIRRSEPQIGQSDKYISPSGENLALVLHNLIQADYEFEEAIDRAMKAILPDTRRIRAVTSGRLRRYRGSGMTTDAVNRSSSAICQMIAGSDVCWAIILQSPQLPSLIVIDEPEVGIHVAWLPVLAEVASNRRQKRRRSSSAHIALISETISPTSSDSKAKLYALQSKDSATGHFTANQNPTDRGRFVVGRRLAAPGRSVPRPEPWHRGLAMVIWVFAGGGISEVNALIPFLKAKLRRRFSAKSASPTETGSQATETSCSGKNGNELVKADQKNSQEDSYANSESCDFILVIDDLDCHEIDRRKEALLNAVNSVPEAALLPDDNKYVGFAAPEIESGSSQTGRSRWLVIPTSDNVNKRCSIVCRTVRQLHFDDPENFSSYDEAKDACARSYLML